jgi:hypothetical protein
MQLSDAHGAHPVAPFQFRDGGVRPPPRLVAATHVEAGIYVEALGIRGVDFVAIVEGSGTVGLALAHPNESD